jgi:hypothetical protein
MSGSLFQKTPQNTGDFSFHDIYDKGLCWKLSRGFFHLRQSPTKSLIISSLKYFVSIWPLEAMKSTLPYVPTFKF